MSCGSLEDQEVNVDVRGDIIGRVERSKCLEGRHC